MSGHSHRLPACRPLNRETSQALIAEGDAYPSYRDYEVARRSAVRMLRADRARLRGSRSLALPRARRP